ncbi:MAG: DNA polymerase III subunit delta [Planctomycetota bacterium]
MKIAALLGRLSGGKIPAVTVLFGGEPWFVNEAIGAIRVSFLGEDGEGFLSLDAPRGPGDRDAVPLPEAVDEARTVPMFGGRKVVVLRAPALADEEVGILAGLAKSAPPFSRFVLVLPSLGAKAQKALTKAGAAVAESKRLFETAWPTKPEWDTELNKWAARRARDIGKRMTLRTAHLLTGLLGNDLGALDGAIARLSLSVGERPGIEEEDIEVLAGGGRDFGAFAFGEAVYARDVPEAFRVARNAFREGIEDQRGRRVHGADVVAGRLLWSARYRLKHVHEARRLLDEGRSDEEVVGAIGTGKRNPALIRAVEQAKGIPLDTLQRHFVLLTDAEAELRTPVPQEVVVETLIARLTGDDDD